MIVIVIGDHCSCKKTETIDGKFVFSIEPNRAVIKALLQTERHAQIVERIQRRINESKSPGLIGFKEGNCLVIC